MWGEDTVKLSDKGRHTQGHVVGVNAAMSLQPRWILFMGTSETNTDRLLRREYHIVVLGAGMYSQP